MNQLALICHTSDSADFQSVPRKAYVASGFVTSPEDWKYSSARNFQEDHTVLPIDDTGFLG